MDDDILEGGEIFNLHLTSAVGTEECDAKVGQKDKVTITITDNEDGKCIDEN